MAGHSKFKNIMHRKGAQDKKRAKLFSRLIREISVAAKIGGTDPDSNPRLRAAVNNALSSNMAKDNISKKQLIKIILTLTMIKSLRLYMKDLVQVVQQLL